MNESRQETVAHEYQQATGLELVSPLIKGKG